MVCNICSIKCRGFHLETVLRSIEQYALQWATLLLLWDLVPTNSWMCLTTRASLCPMWCHHWLHAFPSCGFECAWSKVLPFSPTYKVNKYSLWVWQMHNLWHLPALNTSRPFPSVPKNERAHCVPGLGDISQSWKECCGAPGNFWLKQKERIADGGRKRFSSDNSRKKKEIME